MSGINDALDRMDALLEPGRDLLAIPYTSACVAACRADMGSIRQHISKQNETVSALLEALKTAREYVESDLRIERMNFKGHENCSEIPAIERDLAMIDAALLAAGEGL